MALNAGSDESAVLEIEVDTGSFERGMKDVEQKASAATNKINKHFEFMGNSVKKTFDKIKDSGKSAAQQLQADIERGVQAYERQAKAAEKAADRQQKKMAIAAAAAIVAWKKFFDFLESGSGEGAESFKRLHEEFDSFSADVAEATASSGAMQTLNGILAGIFTGADGAAGAMRTLGEIIGSLAGGPFIAGVTAMERLARAAATIAGVQMSFAPNRGSAPSGPSVASRSEAARTASLGANPELQIMDELAVVGSPRGSGGGGGRDALEAKLAAMRAQEAEFKQRALAQQEFEMQAQQNITDALKNSYDARDALNAAYYARLRSRDQEHADQHSRNVDLMIAQKEHEDQVTSEIEQKRAAALDATISALETVNQIMMKGGPAAQGVARVLMAVQAAIYAQKAAGEVAEAIAAAARYDTWGAVNHAAAAVQFGIAAGMKLGAAIGGGSSSARSGGGGGGGMALAEPRGSGGGGGGGTVINATIVFNAAGEVIDDSAYRRLGSALSEIERRGYWRGSR